MENKLPAEQYRKVEGYLRGYNAFKTFLEHAPQKLEALKAEFKGVSGVSYSDDRGDSSGEVASSVEKEVIKRDEKIKDFEAKIARHKERINVVDVGLGALNEEDRKIIEMFYIQGKTWYEIVGVINKCERACRNKRSNAMSILYIAMFGLEDDETKENA